MKGVIFYSNTNQSRAAAAYFAESLGWESYDLHCPVQAKAAAEATFERAVLVFPVHCQNLPYVIADFLQVLRAKRLAVIATYGRMCHGNVLYEVQKRYRAGEIVAAAYLPMQHTYLPASGNADLDVLRGMAVKMTAPDPVPVRVPQSYKNPFADLLPATRSRMGVGMRIDLEKCTHCGICERGCLHGGILHGSFTNTCIRCLRCVENCPEEAISYRIRLPLRLYLKKKPTERAEVYL